MRARIFHGFTDQRTRGASTVRVSLQREGQNLPRFYCSPNTRSKHSQCFTSAWGPESSTVLLITEHAEQAQPGFHFSVRARIFHGFTDHRTRGASTTRVSVLREGHNLLPIYWSLKHAEQVRPGFSLIMKHTGNVYTQPYFNLAYEW